MDNQILLDEIVKAMDVLLTEKLKPIQEDLQEIKTGLTISVSGLMEASETLDRINKGTL